MSFHYPLSPLLFEIIITFWSEYFKQRPNKTDKQTHYDNKSHCNYPKILQIVPISFNYEMGAVNKQDGKKYYAECFGLLLLIPWMFFPHNKTLFSTLLRTFRQSSRQIMPFDFPTSCVIV